MAPPFARRPLVFVLAALLALTLAGPAHATVDIEVGNIDTIAGGGDLSLPVAVAVDGDGNLYIADSDDHRVRKVTPDGHLSIVAGNGEDDFDGDGPATEHALDLPQGVAVDGEGNLYIADTRNHRVRKVDAAGEMTTVAGNGEDDFDGDGPATEHALDRPSGVAVDADGNLYIADTRNERVRKVTPAGEMTTVAGDGEGDDYSDGPATERSLDAPLGVAVDDEGNLYIADSDDHRVLKVDLAGDMTTVAGTGDQGFNGDGTATDKELDHPSGVAVHGDDLYIADTSNNRVRKVDLAGQMTTVAGTGTAGFNGDGTATVKQLDEPTGVAVDGAGNLYIADSENDRVRKVVGDEMTTVAGALVDGGQALAAVLDRPEGLVADGEGGYFLAGGRDRRVHHVGADGVTTTVAGGGDGPGYQADPLDTALDEPTAVAVGPDDALYIADCGDAVLKVVDAGTPEAALSVYAHGLDCPYGLAFDGDGNLYVADSDVAVIRKVPPGGADGPGEIVAGVHDDWGPDYDPDPLQATFDWPNNVAVGPDGALYIADCGYAVLKVVDAGTLEAELSVIAGKDDYDYDGDGDLATEALLDCPRGLAFDDSGDLYIGDSGNAAVRKVSDGIITTVAGGNEQGFSGDGGDALDAELGSTLHVALSDDGSRLLISDSSNHRVRALQLSSTDDGDGDNGDGDNGGGSGSDGGGGSSAPAPRASIEQVAPPGGTVSTLPPGAQVTAEQPVGASVTTPTGGAVSIQTDVGDPDDAPDGFTMLGVSVTISAPPGTVEAPLVIGFALDASLLGGIDPQTVVPMRDGVEVADCDDPSGSSAAPDPCVASRTVDAEGDLTIVVRTSQASTWTFGVGDPAAPPGFDDGCPPAAFTDVARDSTHVTAIDCAAFHRIARGYADGTFGPADTVRRDQMASFLARTLTAAGVDLPAASHSFTDLAGNTHGDAVGQLAAAGIVEGVSASSYDPAGSVRRDQMASFLTRAAAYAGLDTTASASTFTDVAGNTHETAIGQAYQLGLAEGVDTTTYSPTLDVRRDQMASFLIRLHDRL